MELIKHQKMILIILSDNDEIPNLESKQFQNTSKDIILFKQFFFIISLIFYMTKLSGLVQKRAKKKI